MSEHSRDDIRKLLRTFGVKADEAISEYLEEAPGDEALTLRVTLEDVTSYAGDVPAERLEIVIEREIRR